MVDQKPVYTVTESQPWAAEQFTIGNYKPPMGVEQFSTNVRMIHAAHAPGSESAKAAALLLVIECLRSNGFGPILDQLLELLDPAQEQITTAAGKAALAVQNAYVDEHTSPICDTPNGEAEQ